MTLREKVLKAAAFTEADSNMSGRDAMFVKGITIAEANARLIPLIEALAEISEAAKEIAESKGEDIRRWDLWETLAKLEALLKDVK